MKKCMLILAVLISFPYLSRAEKAKNFELRDIRGRVYRLYDYCGEGSQFKKKAIILSFFATYCRPCIDVEVPALIKIYRDFFRKGLEVFLIGFGMDQAEMADFLAQNDIPFPALLDTNKSIAQLYLVYGLPRTFIISKDCNIVTQISGAIKNYEAYVRGIIKKLLRGK